MPPLLLPTATILALSSLLLTAMGSKSEQSLMDDLLGGYSPLVRPVIEVADIVQLQLAVRLHTLAPASDTLELLLCHQMGSHPTLPSFHPMLHFQTWTDTYLIWNRATYEGQGSVVLPASRIWLPRIAILNSVDGLASLESLSGRSGQEVWVDSDGLVHWELWSRVRVPCPVLETLPPSTEAECRVSYASHLYPEHELSLSLTELDTAFTLTHPASLFALHSAGVWSRMDFTPRGDQRISDLAFTLRRRPSHLDAATPPPWETSLWSQSIRSLHNSSSPAPPTLAPALSLLTPILLRLF